jgi:histidine ammonia-lyase
MAIVLYLDEKPLNLNDVVQVAENKCKVAIKAPKLSKLTERQDETEVRNFLRARCAMIGPPMPTSWVRAGMLLLITAILRETMREDDEGGDETGQKTKSHNPTIAQIRPKTLDTLLFMLNEEITPVLRVYGTDMSFLAAIALALCSEGDVLFKGLTFSAATAMQLNNKRAACLSLEEAVEITKGCFVTLGVACLAHAQSESLLHWSIATLSLSCEALCCRPAEFDAAIQKRSLHPGEKFVAQCLDSLLKNSKRFTKITKITTESFRSASQVLGSLSEILSHNASTLRIELANVESDRAEYIAQAAQRLQSALCSVADMSQRRIAQLVAQTEKNERNERNERNEPSQSVLEVLDLHLVGEMFRDAMPHTMFCVPAKIQTRNGYATVKTLMRAIYFARQVVSHELLLATRSLSFFNTADLGFFAAKHLDKFFQMLSRDANETEDFYAIVRRVKDPMASFDENDENDENGLTNREICESEWNEICHVSPDAPDFIHDAQDFQETQDIQYLEDIETSRRASADHISEHIVQIHEFRGVEK